MYVVCLNCGREFAYSWDEMKVVSANPVSAAVADSSPAASTWEHRAARLTTLLNPRNLIPGGVAGGDMRSRSLTVVSAIASVRK
jgi:hypothetical protein